MIGTIVPDWKARKAWLDRIEHLLGWERVEIMMIAVLRSVLPEQVMTDIELVILSDTHGSNAAEYSRAVKSVAGGTLPPITPNIWRRLWISLGRLD